MRHLIGLAFITMLGSAYGASTDTFVTAGTKMVELRITRAPEVVKAMNKTGTPRIEKLSEHAICSGAFVDSTGDILTARHCTEGADHIDVTPYTGGEYRAVIVAQSKVHDLALIHIDALDTPHFILAKSLLLGEQIYVMGSPLGITGTINTGIVAKLNGDVNYIDCSALPGNSGGPAFNDDGELVGVVTAGFIVLYGTTHLNIMQSIAAIISFAMSIR